MPIELPSHEEDTAPTLSFAASSLAELLAQAREALLTHGVRHETQRGATRSLNGVTLTWTNPEHATVDGLEWTADEIAWYLRVFIEKRPENDPARLAENGALVFPYTYATRSRYWDGGWGYLAALLEAIGAEGLTLEGMRVSGELFEEALTTLGERLHLQTVLSLLALHPPALLAHWREHPDLLAETRHPRRRHRRHRSNVRFTPRHRLLAHVSEPGGSTPAAHGHAAVSALPVPARRRRYAS
jgi:hypothetical protein